jgi:hypothetical protein
MLPSGHIQSKTESKRIPKLDCVVFDNEQYFKISDHNAMRPFFMSIVSDSNHWLFVSSNGGITAGRKNPEYALFPYYTDDKVTESSDMTGSKTIIRIKTDDGFLIWEPFSERFTHRFNISRNLYKSIYGNKIIFEEINHDLGLVFSTKWQSSNLFGFVKQSQLENTTGKEVSLTLMDGVQNIMPYGVPSDLQAKTSNLVDAYKRSELIKKSGVGVFALSAIIVDKAEPSEALKANIAWSFGLDKPQYLLSSLQLNNFRNGLGIQEEDDVKGEKGAYLIYDQITLKAGEKKEWGIVLNVNQSQSQVIALSEQIVSTQDLAKTVLEDVELGTSNLLKLNMTADGMQVTADIYQDARHFSNTLFNIMRGGVFDDNYTVEKKDLLAYLERANKKVFANHQPFLNQLGETIDYRKLKQDVWGLADADLIRLCTEYLPLKFSRRHGDPSRPWNMFSINTRSEIDGSKILDYQGNWRDIFQNWEALAHSFPEFMDGMIFKFLNASTFDGYNPYRVMKDGFDWETIEPDNPWSYIGYWGDHQVIYLLKFLEFSESYFPGRLKALLDKNVFAYAAVPYVIKPYGEIVKNAKDTILFDHAWEKQILHARQTLGGDGALLALENGEILKVNFLEKILAMTLSKLSNFIPNGGIWMNTQRPEWNDANNALVGNGVSMVTLYYLRRFLHFVNASLINDVNKEVEVSEEMFAFLHGLSNAFKTFETTLSNGFDKKSQRAFVDSIGIAASEFRNQIYQNGFSGQKKFISTGEVKDFFSLCQIYIENTIAANRREDNLYHAYNLVGFSEDALSISYLSEMLEGQVAVLSSGFLSPNECNRLLDALKQSTLYRQDQESYILYPNKNLAGFISKNNINKQSAEQSPLIRKLMEDGNSGIVEKDILGNYHFNGNFRNATDLSDALQKIKEKGYAQLVEEHGGAVIELYEEVFNHKAFTGRSGTFFGYEGLGSIYWHMVSKLLLAVQECYLKAYEEDPTAEVTLALHKHFEAIKKGIGVHKTPSVYGAFPTDPYSHTPMHRGAQQPGMTGQVKEDFIARKNELGVHIKDGEIHFIPSQIFVNDFLANPKTIEYFNVEGETESIDLKQGDLFFLYCQVPVIYHLSGNKKMEVYMKDGSVIENETGIINNELAQKIFGRTGEIRRIQFHINLPD